MMAEGGGYAEVTRRHLDQGGSTLELETKLGLEFQLSDLNERVEVDKLVLELQEQLLKVVTEDDIVGIEFKPSKRFAQKCMTVFTNETAKNKVQIQGLSVFNKTVTLTNPGQGVVRVEINNVSMLIPNDIIKDWLATKVGGMDNIVQFRNDHYIIRGQKRKWVSGTRFAYVKNLASPLSPADKFRYNGKDIQVNMWHYGQTHMKCRFCYQVVPKGHECARRQQKQGCHKCGSLEHLQRECPEKEDKRRCFRCGSLGHMIGSCTIQVKEDGMGGQKTTIQGAQGRTPQAPKPPKPTSPSSSQRGGSFLIPNLIDQALDKKKADDEAKKKKAEEAEKKRLAREKENQEALEERERQHQQAIEQNRRQKEENERMERAAVAAAAAEKRHSSTLSSNEEALPPNALQLETSSSSMEVDIPSGDEVLEEDEEDDSASDSDDDSCEDTRPDSVDDEQEAKTSSTDEDDENDDRLDTTQFHDAFDTALRFSPHQAATVALVGGSNVPHIKLVSDNDLQVQTHALWEGGAEIIQGAHKVSEVNPDTREKFDVVVTHLGTCNFPCKGESSVMSHFKDYMEMTRKVRDMCPNAHIVMSGILPQAGEGRSLANEQIKSFNAALKAVGDDDKEPYLYFCDNWPLFVEGDQVLDGLFKDPHTYGVHVNDQGSVVLATAIMQKVKEVFYWERLGVPLSPSH